MKMFKYVRYTVPGLLFSGAAFAQGTTTAQPDGSAVISYIEAGAAVLLAVIAAKYAPAGAVLVASWVKRVIAR